MTNYQKLAVIHKAMGNIIGDPEDALHKRMTEASVWMDVIDLVAAGAGRELLDQVCKGISAGIAGTSGSIAADYAYSRFGDLTRPLTDYRLSVNGLFDTGGSLKNSGACIE
jgi:hypothetical protein